MVSEVWSVVTSGLWQDKNLMTHGGRWPRKPTHLTAVGWVGGVRTSPSKVLPKDLASIYHVPPLTKGSMACQLAPGVWGKLQVQRRVYRLHLQRNYLCWEVILAFYIFSCLFLWRFGKSVVFSSLWTWKELTTVNGGLSPPYPVYKARVYYLKEINGFSFIF